MYRWMEGDSVRGNIRIEQDMSIFEILHVGTMLEMLLQGTATFGRCGERGLVDASSSSRCSSVEVHCGVEGCSFVIDVDRWNE